MIYITLRKNLSGLYILRISQPTTTENVVELTFDSWHDAMIAGSALDMARTTSTYTDETMEDEDDSYQSA